ncbi:MAG: amino acid ABC transporter substrate-binding protein [Reyranellales bacterium]
MHLVDRILGLCAAGSILALFALPAVAEPTLDVVKKRGQLTCGVSGEVPGFSFFNAGKKWEGLDVDLCRAIATAVLGEATKVKFIPVTAKQRFEALKAGDFDVLARNTTVTLQRLAGFGVQFAAVNYYDGQAFAVETKLGIKNVTELRSSTVCILKGTTHEANMENWFKSHRLSVFPKVFDTQDEMYDAFFANRCLAITDDASAMASVIARRGKAADYTILPEVISKEPLGPFVRRGDDAWLEVVRWTHYAMIEAEERGISWANVRDFRQSVDPDVKLFLGFTPGNGTALGLDDRWAYEIVKQVGNYGDSFERNLGSGSPLNLARGINALWTKGGQMYPWPLH